MTNDFAMRIQLVEDDPDDVVLLRQTLSEVLQETCHLDQVEGLSVGLERLAEGVTASSFWISTCRTAAG